MTTFFLEYRNIFIFILCSFVLATVLLLFTRYILSFVSKVELKYFPKVQIIVIAIMFLLFNIEVLYLFPLVSSLYSLVTLDVFIILGFYVLLLVGLLYEISRKVLDFQTSTNNILFNFFCKPCVYNQGKYYAVNFLYFNYNKKTFIHE